jgi:hypothetical protein
MSRTQRALSHRIRLEGSVCDGMKNGSLKLGTKVGEEMTLLLHNRIAD